MKIAVVVLLYNRPEHSIRVFESLLQNGVTSCIAYMDRADDHHSKRQQEIIVDYLNSHAGLRVDLKRNESRLGVAGSVIRAVNETLSMHEGMIFLEDDCVLRPGGVNYFLDGLNKLRDNRSVRSICGYRYPGCDFSWGNNEELLLLKRFCPWGWATWAERWKDFNANLREVVSRCRAQNLEIGAIAGDLSRLCDQEEYLNGQRDIWTINWILEHFLTATYAIYPRETMIENIGFDGTGQHCVPTEVFDQSSHMSMLVLRRWDGLEYYPSNEAVLKRFMDSNGPKAYAVAQTGPRGERT